MSGINTFSTFATDAQTYIAAQLLKRIHRDVIVYPMARHEKLPNRFSTTFQFTRFEKLPLPQQSLTEGVTPANGETMTISTVQAVMNQWGDYVTLTDVAVITAKHPALEQAVILLAEQARETIDRECINLLLTNANVFFPGTVANRAGVLSTSYIDTPTVKKVCAGLRRAGAHPIMGRLYQGLMDPSVEMDLLGDSTFQTAASYSNIYALMNGESGIWMGVRWVVSNIIPTLLGLSNFTLAGANVTGGTLAASTNYFIQVVQRDTQLYFVTGTSQVQTVGSGGGNNAINVTLPNVSGVVFDIYIGTSAINGVLYSAGNLPNQVISVLSVPASGAVAPAPPTIGITVHFSWIFGDEAFAAPELMSLETYITPAVPSDSDPLVQRRKVSWKFMFKPVICNDVYISRIESASAF